MGFLECVWLSYHYHLGLLLLDSPPPPAPLNTRTHERTRTGSVESLICHPATTTHVTLGREARLSAGISDGLVRLSVGLENKADLARDLDQAFRAAAPSGTAGPQ
jgi:hypothetical protein